MTYDKNLSPVGWYVVSYLLRFVELNDDRRTMMKLDSCRGRTQFLCVREPLTMPIKRA